MRVSYDTMLQEFKRVLMKKGFQEDRAEAAAAIFAQNSQTHRGLFAWTESFSKGCGVFGEGRNRS